MNQPLTDLDHIRSMLNEMNESPNYRDIKGPGDVDPPEDLPTYEDDPNVSDAFEKLNNMVEKVTDIQNAVEMDIESGKESFNEYIPDGLIADSGFLSDLPLGIEVYLNKVVPYLDKLEDIASVNPESEEKLKETVNSILQWADSIEDFLSDHMTELADTE